MDKMALSCSVEMSNVFGVDSRTEDRKLSLTSLTSTLALTVPGVSLTRETSKLKGSNIFIVRWKESTVEELVILALKLGETIGLLLSDPRVLPILAKVLKSPMVQE